MFGKKNSDLLLNQGGRSYRCGETMQIEGDLNCSGAARCCWINKWKCLWQRDDYF